MKNHASLTLTTVFALLAMTGASVAIDSPLPDDQVASQLDEGITCFKLDEGMYKCLDTLTNKVWVINHNHHKLACQLDYVLPKCE